VCKREGGCRKEVLELRHEREDCAESGQRQKSGGPTFRQSREPCSKIYACRAKKEMCGHLEERVSWQMLEKTLKGNY